MISEVYNIDCLEYMQSIPDKFFDLAIVDPPYGINFDNYERGGMGQKVKKRYTKNGDKSWDSTAPTTSYFQLLKRVSRHQIIWGANYFPDLWPCKSFIFWYKHQPLTNFSAGELAYTSFDKPSKCFDYMCYGSVNGDIIRIHPTQKPVDLYKWLLHNYAKKGDKIFDSHMGSQSSRLAAWDMGFDYYGCELDKDYFKEGCKRFDEFKLQLKMF